MVTRRIPLFPLNVVLFPGMLLPLHIFEPRYRQMIRTCLEGDRTFGVCLIRSGAEVGGPAVPYTIGTTCEIVSTTPLDEGKLDLLSVGRRRFRIRSLFEERDYLEAEVELLPEPEPPELGELPGQVSEVLTGYISALLALQGEVARRLSLPEDAEALSHFAGAVLQAPLPVRQELLECGDTGERLRRELELLESGLAELERIRPLREKAARPFRGSAYDVSLN